MRKFSKSISASLCALTLATVLSGTYAVTVKAQSIQSIEQNQNIKKVTDSQEAIKLIEEKFLIQNLDGTTSISLEANKYIDSEIFNQIKRGSEQINKKIKAGDLIFDRSSKKLNEKKHVSPAGVNVSGSYIWHWYGFDFVMNSYNSGLAAIQLNTLANQLAVGAGAAVSLGAISVGVAAGITAWMVYGYAGDCQTGQYNGNGAILYFYGDPSWAQIYHSSVR